MPSPRKRIGFLPSSEVQNIIDKICKHNKLSQSKVTGILVEEALYSRGVLNNLAENLSLDFSKYSLDRDIKINNKNSNSDQTSINEEYQMIQDFIEYKFFKKIINQKRSI